MGTQYVCYYLILRIYNPMHTIELTSLQNVSEDATIIYNIPVYWDLQIRLLFTYSTCP